jgi:hypothetical protein
MEHPDRYSHAKETNTRKDVPAIQRYNERCPSKSVLFAYDPPHNLTCLRATNLRNAQFNGPTRLNKMIEAMGVKLSDFDNI